jgi:hypothetical protein
MASAGARAYMGVWGLCPQWGPGAKPLARGSGAKPPEAEAYITIAGVNFCLKNTDEQQLWTQLIVSFLLHICNSISASTHDSTNAT